MTFNIMVHSTHQKTDFFDDIKLSGEPKKSMERAFTSAQTRILSSFSNKSISAFQNGNFFLTAYSLYLLKS